MAYREKVKEPPIDLRVRKLEIVSTNGQTYHLSEGKCFTVGSKDLEFARAALAAFHPDVKVDGHIKIAGTQDIEGRLFIKDGRIRYENYGGSVALVDSEGKNKIAMFGGNLSTPSPTLTVDSGLSIRFSNGLILQFELKDIDIRVVEGKPVQPVSERNLLNQIEGQNYDQNSKGIIRTIDGVYGLLQKEVIGGKFKIGTDKNGVGVTGGMWVKDDSAHLPKDGEAIVVGRPEYLKEVLIKTHFVERVADEEKVYVVLTGGYVNKLRNLESEETQMSLALMLGLKKEFTNKVIILSPKKGAEQAPRMQSTEKTGIDYGEDREVVENKYKELFAKMPSAVKTENGVSITPKGSENTFLDISEVVDPKIEKRAYAVIKLSKGSHDSDQVKIHYF